MSTTGQINYYNSLIGREINRVYLIQEQLAVGGMGAVFKATDLRDNSIVAVKVISPHLAANPVFVKRFQREAKVGWALSHPNVAKVHEFGETDTGLLFMVMEYINGETLGDYMERNGPIKITRCMEILKPLCEALDAAHKRNILHRDLKPANILLTKTAQGENTVKLVDFGLVKLLQPDDEITKGGANLTGMGEACGTPFYMSPEQVIGQPLAPTADIYSLGVILYQMLTARMPIESNSIRQILALKINQDIPPPSQRFPFIPSNLDKVLQKAMARDPRYRYQTAIELYQAFHGVVAEIASEISQPSESSVEQEVVESMRTDYQNYLDNAAAPNKQNKVLWAAIGVLSALLVFLIVLLIFR